MLVVTLLAATLAFQGQNAAGGGTWSEFLDQPYSDEAFLAHAKSIGQDPSGAFRDWYISGVYRARQGKKPPFWVVQIYDGSKSGFRFGRLVVLGPQGEHLRTISKKRVHWSLIASDADFVLSRKLASEMIVVDLPDLDGDSFAEIPTQRWDPVRAGVQARESTSIYLTRDKAIPCNFCVEFYERWPAADLAYGHCFLHYDAEKKGQLKLSTPIYIATGNGFGKTELPDHQLATFDWDSATKKWTGPQQGPNGIWKVLQRD